MHTRDASPELMILVVWGNYTCLRDEQISISNHLTDINLVRTSEQVFQRTPAYHYKVLEHQYKTDIHDNRGKKPNNTTPSLIS